MSGGTRPPPRQPEGEELTITEFNDLCRKKKFKEGPFTEDFGSGYGEPYSPEHYVWGTLKKIIEKSGALENQKPSYNTKRGKISLPSSWSLHYSF